MTDQKERQAIFTLHRYFMWSDQMKNHFEQMVLQTPNITDLHSPEAAKIFMYMSYWYASLYVVIDGWKILKLNDPQVDTLRRSSTHVYLLKKYRDGVFHFQRKYLDDRFLNLMKNSQASVAWTRNIHDALGAFFLRWFAAQKTQIKGPA